VTQQQYIIRRKISVVELAQTLGNISEACRSLRVSRQHYYDIKSALEADGVESLLEKSRNRPRVAKYRIGGDKHSAHRLVEKRNDHESHVNAIRSHRNPESVAIGQKSQLKLNWFALGCQYD
jgi:hypothetical protein